ncbi:unnamed protein product [Trichobilharzia regenti]|nr:unnamed protein product [Trichobilharzia regenti]
MTRAKVRLDRARTYYANAPASQRKAKQQEYHKVLRVSRLIKFW